MTTQNTSKTPVADWSHASGATKPGLVTKSGALQLPVNKLLPGIMANLGSIERTYSTECGPVTSELEDMPNGGFKLTVKYDYPDESGKQITKPASIVLNISGPGKGLLEINGPNPGTVHISAEPHAATRQVVELVKWELEHSRGRPNFRPSSQPPIGLAS